MRKALAVADAGTYVTACHIAVTGANMQERAANRESIEAVGARSRRRLGGQVSFFGMGYHTAK
jgi:hypothetical protein